MDAPQKPNIAARAHYFNLEKRIKIRLEYIDSLNLPDYKYQPAEGLTGYSKEKIRQNNSMSDKAKEDLRGLLLSIADQLK